MTRDPIGYDGGINLYAYCDGNPVMSADPSGLDDEMSDDDIEHGRNRSVMPGKSRGTPRSNWAQGMRRKYQRVGSFLAGLNPIANAITAKTGKDAATNEKVSTTGRVLAAVGAIPGVSLESEVVSEVGTATRYGVHWTSYGGAEGILTSNRINATSGNTKNLLYFEVADSLSKLRKILDAGGKTTGADGQEVAIIFNATGLPIRSFKGGANVNHAIDLGGRYKYVSHYTPKYHSVKQIMGMVRRMMGM